MDRNELAARFAVADYGAKCRAYYAGGPKGPGPDVYSGTAEDAFKMADLFLDYAERIDARPAKSTLTPAPVPPPATTPAPEAKRPTHVRVTRLAHSDRPATVGKVYEVVRWNYDGSPDVIGDNGSNMSLSKPDGSDEKVWPAWEPAPCPPPVAGSGATLPDNVREFLLDVEYAAKWANQPQGPAIEYVKGRLKELAARAHDILTSPVRP